MLYVIGLIVTVLGSLGAFVLKLINDKENLTAKISALERQKEAAEWDDKIKDILGDVDETETDYSKSRDSFNNKYGPGSGNA